MILGIDPGLAATGWGLIDAAGSSAQYVNCGVIETNTKQNHVVRLECIYRQISAIAADYQPQVACVERVFANLNGKSSMALGEARGAAVAALLRHEMPVVEMSALQIKKSMTGYGRADKKQVAKMVLLMLDNAPQKLRADATDALACALSYIPMSRLTNSSAHLRLPARRGKRRTYRRRA